MNPIKTIKYHLYLFQLENYNPRRFLQVVLKRLKPVSAPRKELVWTPKAAALFFLAFLTQVLVIVYIGGSLGSWLVWAIGVVVLFYAFSWVFFIFLIFASIIIYPLDVFLKFLIIAKAKNKISGFPQLKIIGITGSYGKTTMKEALKQVLSIKYQVLATPESVNTPVGISRLILKELNQETEIFIVEMGAYRRGDIKALCEIAKPDVAILTGINEAHLERFGKLENTIAAKFEIVEHAKPQALVVLNEDNELIKENYKKYLGGRKVRFYSKNSPFAPSLIKEGEGGSSIPLLGEYAKGIVNGAVTIAKELGLTDEQISRGVSQIKPIPHRLQPILNEASNILIIDDSYSGNPDGAREAIKVLSRYKSRRKIYITPGLVEMGERSREIHLEIGRQLAQVADIVILIKNSVTPWIEEGIFSLSSSGLPKAKPGDPGLSSTTIGDWIPDQVGNDNIRMPEITWFNTTQSAHAALPKILRPGDVVLFQNDWPENYV